MAIEQHIIADKNLIRTARVISMIFTPFSIPFMAFLILFVFSYLRIMPLQYKLIVLGVVYCFTILMPTLTIFLFRKINGFTPEDLTERKRRYVPFILTITSYVFCLLMMHRLNIPWYMTGSGAMVEGWAYIGSSWYYMVPGNGAMVGAGWHLIDNSWYYMNGSGAMCSNRWIGNYYVGGSGAMLTNTWVGSYWVGADGNWIPNYDPDQNARWVQDGNTWYYQRTDGSRITNSWKKINGTWYYFAGSGAMLTGWNVVGGSWYFFNGSGAMQTGWGQVDGSWYYFGGDGAMKTGWINDGKRNYYLKPNGVWKNILIGVIGNNEAGAATTAAKVREMGVDAVIVTGGYDPSQYDGIIIPGGGDLDPSRYGQANTGSSNIDNALDDRQIDAVKRSAEAGKPVLGICKGIQLVNVAFGGTLNQNIGGHMGVWHSAHVVAGGWLSGVYSGSVSVLSYHHQSIRDLAPGFQVDMRAGDGTVEAISNSAKRVYGVQFHPEQMNNDTGNRCMKQFVAICTN